MPARVEIQGPNLSIPQAELDKPSDTISRLMQNIIDQKEANVEKALKGRVNPLEITMISGDLFNMGLMAFQGAQIIKPSIATIPAVSTASLVFGEIAGAITIAVSFICLKGGLQALKNGDKSLAMRLFLTFFSLALIGTIMIITSLATKVAALGAISLFFAANPWLLPVLFFTVSVPVLVEVGKRIKRSHEKSDLAAQLQTDNLENLIQGEDPTNPFHLLPLLMMVLERKEKEAQEVLTHRMELLQADMGVEAAIDTFKLLKDVLENNTGKPKDVESRLKLVKSKISKWNRIQYIRLFQQVLYTAAFGVSMGTVIRPEINTTALKATQSFALSGANAIPLALDISEPFARNAPIVVAKAQL